MRETPAAEALPSSPIAKARLYLVFLLFAVGFGYVIVGLALRQLIQTGDLKAQYETQSRRVVLRPPSRGLIYDRNGYVLVENRIRWSIKADLLALQPEIHRKYLALIKAERVRGALCSTGQRRSSLKIERAKFGNGPQDAPVNKGLGYAEY